MNEYRVFHMFSARDAQNPTAMAQSFSLANVVPQAIGNNRGPWRKVEMDTRKYAVRASGDVFVITGPVFTPESPLLNTGRMRAPTYIYKLVYDTQKGTAWAHWQENRDGKQDARPISLDELKLRTGIDFLPGVQTQAEPTLSQSQPSKPQPTQSTNSDCPCGSEHVCVGTRGGRYCITSGGSKRYGL